MAIPTSLHTLISGNVVEWARIEFKTTWDPEASLKTVTAFANDLDNWGGGYIVIGLSGRHIRQLSVKKSLKGKFLLLSGVRAVIRVLTPAPKPCLKITMSGFIIYAKVLIL